MSQQQHQVDNILCVYAGRGCHNQELQVCTWRLRLSGMSAAKHTSNIRRQTLKPQSKIGFVSLPAVHAADKLQHLLLLVQLLEKHIGHEQGIVTGVRQASISRWFYTSSLHACGHAKLLDVVKVKPTKAMYRSVSVHEFGKTLNHSKALFHQGTASRGEIATLLRIRCQATRLRQSAHDEYKQGLLLTSVCLLLPQNTQS